MSKDNSAPHSGEWKRRKHIRWVNGNIVPVRGHDDQAPVQKNLKKRGVSSRNKSKDALNSISNNGIVDGDNGPTVNTDTGTPKIQPAPSISNIVARSNQPNFSFLGDIPMPQAPKFGGGPKKYATNQSAKPAAGNTLLTELTAEDFRTGLTDMSAKQNRKTFAVLASSK